MSATNLPAGDHPFQPPHRPRRGPFDAPDADVFDRVTRLAASLLRVADCHVALVDAPRPPAHGRANDLAWTLLPDDSPTTLDLLRAVLTGRAPLATPDIRVRAGLAVDATGVGYVAFLGTPIVARHGDVRGVLYATVPTRHKWSGQDLATLADCAAILARDIDRSDALHDAYGLVLTAAFSEEERAVALDSISDGCFALNRDWRVTFANASAARILGHATDDLVGRDFWARVPELLDTTFEQACRRAMTHLVAVEFEWQLPASGAWLEARIYPSARGVTVYLRDITDRLRAEEARRRGEEWLRALVQNAPDIIGVVNIAGNVIYSSPSIQRVLGWSPEDLKRRRLFTLIHPDDMPLARRQLRDAVAGPGPTPPVVVRVRHIDGSWRHLESVATNLLNNPSVGGVVINSRDITERRQAEEERERLLAREQSARRDAEAANAAIGRLQAVSDVALSHLSVDQLLRELLERIREALASDSATILLREDDGEQLVVRAWVGLDALGDAEARLPLGAGFAGGIAASGEPRVVDDVARLDALEPALRGNRSLAGVPLRVGPRVVGVLHVGSAAYRRFTLDDVRLLQLVAGRAALAIENARLYESEREARALAEAAVRVREEFISIASHEFKTPLTAIKAATQFLRRLQQQRRGDSEQARQLVDTLSSEITRLQELVRDLLDVSQLQRGGLTLRPVRVDLVKLARQAFERLELSPLRSSRHRLVFDAPAPVVGVWDPARLDQVLTNLLGNALKYSPNGGTIALSIQATDGLVEIVVRDEGIGIAPEEQATLFEPFARSDEARRTAGGAGLGLYITAQIIAQHGGAVAVDSRPGHGSVFTVRLPLGNRE